MRDIWLPPGRDLRWTHWIPRRLARLTRPPPKLVFSPNPAFLSLPSQPSFNATPILLFSSPRDSLTTCELIALSSWDLLRRHFHMATMLYTTSPELMTKLAARGNAVNNEYILRCGVPFLRSVFSMSEDHLRYNLPSTPLAMYTNGDIMFFPDLLQTAEACLDFARAQGKSLLVTGRRVNIYPEQVPLLSTPEGLDSPSPISEEWFLDPDTPADIRERGELFTNDAQDYFLFTPGLFDYPKVPEFMLGRVAFDNWLVWYGNYQPDKVVIIDATRTLTAMHINHDGATRHASHTRFGHSRSRGWCSPARVEHGPLHPEQAGGPRAALTKTDAISYYTAWAGDDPRSGLIEIRDRREDHQPAATPTPAPAPAPAQ
ncbi:hypothetical protein PAPYR_3372 [Paratrimastix pyriformis]|uniref:Glycosyltransferase n=1 Tax=Paratrimastix pyriformis TaxID=342808 RepID=A0ABQ8UPG6_9EUKA|nr:hypothetical protein PAPYR_3372 [Paratrimastix pyriformis]